MIQDDPFSKLDGKPLATELNHYVTRSEFRRLYGAAPDRSWASFFALSRLARLQRDAALLPRGSDLHAPVQHLARGVSGCSG